MSGKTAAIDNASDDEYQDAVPYEADIYDSCIDELAKQQAELKLKDKPTSKDSEAAANKVESPEKAEEAEDAGAKANEPIEPDIDDEEKLKQIESLLSEEELDSRHKQAEELKKEGNELFKNDEAFEAAKKYDEALLLCPTKYPKERAVLYANRAAAKMKLESNESALEDCSAAITLWPEYMKAVLRRAKLYEQLDRLDEALTDYKRVYELDPGQHEARAAMARLPPIINERNEKLKEEMLSKLKDLGNMVLRPFGLSTSNFQMQQDPNTGSYSINFNQNAGGS